MKKKIMAAVCTITLMSLLAGCYPSEKKKVSSGGDVDVGINSNENSGSNTENEQPEQQTPDDFIWDMDLSYDTPASVKSVRLTLKKWDKDEMEKLLLNGKEIERQFERDCLFYPNEKLYSYDTTDKYSIVFEPGRITINDNDALEGEFKYGTAFYEAEIYTASDEELIAFSREDAVNRANSLIDKLGITNYGEPLITPLKADYINKRLELFKNNQDKQGIEYEYTPWTTDEEIYVLFYPFVFENIQLEMKGLGIPQSTDKATEASRIRVVVTKDKIVHFSAMGVYSANYETVESVPIKYDFNSAVKDMNKFYSTNLLEYPITYYSGKLIYLPSEMTDDKMTVTFVPGWEFLGYTELWERLSPFDRHLEYQYFYADTGLRYMY